jgi:hypothetical protein
MDWREGSLDVISDRRAAALAPRVLSLDASARPLPLLVARKVSHLSLGGTETKAATAPSCVFSGETGEYDGDDQRRPPA